MARNKDKYLTTAIRAPFFKRFGLGSDATKVDHDFDNDYAQTWADATDGSSIEAMRVDTDGNIRIGQEAINPLKKTITFNLAANASLGTQTLFIADSNYNVTGITYVHKTAGTNAGAVTCNITEDIGTQAPGAGTSIMTGTFNCKGTANVVQTATLAATPGNDPSGILTINTGSRLAVVFTGVLTTLAGVVITLTLTPCAKCSQAIYYVKANADLATINFYLANRDHTIMRVDAIWSTAFAAAVTIDITKDTGTQAPGAGTSILAATIAADGAANTVVTPALTATAATLNMAAGDRLSVKYSATTTGVGVCIVVTMMPMYGHKHVFFQLGPNGQMAVDQCWFIADRDYQVVDLSEVHKTAAGGAQKLLVTIDKGAAAPGAGNAVHTDNASAGFDTAAAANTVQVATLNTLRNTLLSSGDRLGLKWAGAAQATAGVCIAAILKPA